MSCPLIAGLLILSAIALAMAQSLPPAGMPSEVPTSPPAKVESCEALDKFNRTDLMEAKTFTKNLYECEKSKDVNKTEEATLLVDLVRKLKGHEDELANLTAYPDIMKTISNCARNITGFDIKDTEMSKHFGLNNTVTFLFRTDECLRSLELEECVDVAYANQLNAITKQHKNAYMRLFDFIQLKCKNSLIREVDSNKGQYSLPSFTLILGSALMVYKFVF